MNKIFEICLFYVSVSHFSSVQFSHSVVSDSFRPHEPSACQASLYITNSRSPPKPMSIVSVIPSNHLILCHPLLLLPSIFPNIRVFSNESVLHIRWPKYWSFSFNITPSNEYPHPEKSFSQMTVFKFEFNHHVIIIQSFFISYQISLLSSAIPP